MGDPRAERARLRTAVWRRSWGPTGLGREGPGTRGCGRCRAGPSGVGTLGRPPWQLPGVLEAALCSPWRRGRGHRFSGPAARSPARGRRARRTGTLWALLVPSLPCNNEWTGGARSRRKRAPPARLAKSAGTRPGARLGLPGSRAAPWGGGAQAVVRASSRASGRLQGPLTKW